jgi:hypothetical protein
MQKYDIFFNKQRKSEEICRNSLSRHLKRHKEACPRRVVAVVPPFSKIISFWVSVYDLQNYKTILSQQHFLERNNYKK